MGLSYLLYFLEEQQGCLWLTSPHRFDTWLSEKVLIATNWHIFLKISQQDRHISDRLVTCHNHIQLDLSVSLVLHKWCKMHFDYDARSAFAPNIIVEVVANNEKKAAVEMERYDSEQNYLCKKWRES